MTVTRKGFLGRAAAVTGAFLMPFPAKAKAAPVEAVEPALVATNHTQIFGEKTLRLTEWWFESTESRGASKASPLKITLVRTSGKVGERTVIASHYLPRGNGIYMQYPPGREPLMPTMLTATKLNPPPFGSETVISLKKAGRGTSAGSGQIHMNGIGYFGMKWEEM